MGRPTFKKLVEKQVKIWEERVWKPDLLPEKEIDESGNSVLVNNDTYNNILNASKFNIVFSKDPDNIYRFLRYGIEKGKVYNSNILFAREALFNTYIAPEESLKDSFNLCQELFKAINRLSYDNKWVVCECLSSDFSDKLASYFISQLQAKKAAGIIFSCNTKLPNNLYNCIKSSGIGNIIEI